MYAPLRTLVQRVFQVSAQAPHVPPGGHGRAHVFRASLAFWRYRMLGYIAGRVLLLIPCLGGAGAAAFGLGAAHWPIAGALIGSLLVLFYVASSLISYVLVRLDYEFRWYVVTDRSLRIRQGILKFEETTLTFANVQNVSIRQGPLERYFGFANVLVETAGGGGSVAQKEQAIAQGGHRGLIRGLENAEAVKQMIREAVVRQGGAGLGDHDDHDPAAPEPVVTLAEAAPALRAVLEEVRALRAVVAPGRVGRSEGGVVSPPTPLLVSEPHAAAADLPAPDSPRRLDSPRRDAPPTA